MEKTGVKDFLTEIGFEQKDRHKDRQTDGILIYKVGWPIVWAVDQMEGSLYWPGCHKSCICFQERRNR